MTPDRVYITTAIPYVNAAPHLGFCLELVLADALARFHRQRGADVHFLSGTDENSLKNVQAALAQLKDRDRDALLLWEEGFSYEEIADTVGLSRGSIGTTMARARARLAAAYQQLEERRGSEDVAH